MTELRAAVSRLAAAVMAADGVVTPSEAEAVSLLSALGLGDLSDSVRQEFARAKQEPIDPAKVAAELELPPEAGAMIVAALAEIAMADGEAAPEERLAIQTIARGLGLADRDTEQILEASIQARSAPGVAADGGGAGGPAGSEPPRQAPPAGTDRDQRLLGVGGAPVQRKELDAAYGRALRAYDPMQLIELGPEFCVLAVRRLSAITDAYERLVARAGGGRS